MYDGPKNKTQHSWSSNEQGLSPLKSSEGQASGALDLRVSTESLSDREKANGLS